MAEFIIATRADGVIIIGPPRHLIEASAVKIGIGDGRAVIGINDGRNFVAVIIGINCGVILAGDIQVAGGFDQSPEWIVAVFFKALAVSGFVEKPR